MITVSVTSDSSLPELNMARRIIIEMIESRANYKLDAAQITVDKICETFNVPKPEPTFNATELAEAEALGKPVCSTAAVEASPIAHVDTPDNTLIPTPQSVFGQAVQNTVIEANPVAPATEGHVIDADGLLWDARIHSSSREMNKDGTWRKRRGVSDELVKQVEAELRSQLNIELGIDKPATVAIPTELGMQEIPAPTSGSMTFSELLDAVTKAMVAGQVTQAKINEALQSIGVAALPHLIARTDLIPAFREALGGVV